MCFAETHLLYFVFISNAQVFDPSLFYCIDFLSSEVAANRIIWAHDMREIVHVQAGQCGNQIGAKVGACHLNLYF